MATYYYNPLSFHSRAESSKAHSPKRSLRVTTSFESSKLTAGLQGYGKYNDNVFKSSLRTEIPFTGTFHSSLSYKSSRQSSTASTTIECMSARTPKPIFQLASNVTSVKHSARADLVTNVAMTELKAKENNILKLKSSVRHQAPAKPKVRAQGRVLKEINREWPSYRSKTSVYSPYCSSLPTEPDSFVSELIGGGSMDINQQLRNIFRVGVKEVNEVNEENDVSVTIPEEQNEADYLGVKNKNKPYVSRQKQLKSFNKL